MGRDQSVEVVFAQDPTSAGGGVLVESAGLLVLTQRKQDAGEIMGRDQGIGVVLTEPAAAQLVCTFEQYAGGSRLTPGLQVSRGTVEQPRDLQGVRVSAVGEIGDGQDVGQQLSPGRPASRIIQGISRHRVYQQLAGERGHILGGGGSAAGCDRPIASTGPGASPATPARALQRQHAHP